MNKIKFYNHKIQANKEKIRQIENSQKNLEYVIDNTILFDIMSENRTRYPTFEEFKNDFKFILEEAKKHQLYKSSTISEIQSTSEYLFSMRIERFIFDILTYDFNVIYKETKGDLHCVTGNDGDLQYIFICSECGTIIINDHSAQYQYNKPTLLCPVCNKLKTDDKGKNKYPFEFITRDKKEWIGRVHYYSMLVKKQLISEKELAQVIEEVVVKNFTSKLKRIWHRYRCKKDFKRVVAKPYVQQDYIAGTDMSNVELKYLKGKI